MKSIPSLSSRRDVYLLHLPRETWNQGAQLHKTTMLPIFIVGQK